MSWYELSVVRRIAATIGFVVMVLTGTCTLLMSMVGLEDFLRTARFLGVPFVAGFLIWWLAIRVGR
ncbi:MAG: hypothetical protein WD036_10345 [Bauldia sp.]